MLPAAASQEDQEPKRFRGMPTAPPEDAGGIWRPTCPKCTKAEKLCYWTEGGPMCNDCAFARDAPLERLWAELGNRSILPKITAYKDANEADRDAPFAYNYTRDMLQEGCGKCGKCLVCIDGATLGEKAPIVYRVSGSFGSTVVMERAPECYPRSMGTNLLNAVFYELSKVIC